MNNKYALGLDVGERRIGVAVASLTARLSSPLTTIDRKKITDVFTRIRQLADEQQASVIIVGLPRNLEGRETLQTDSSRAFAAELAKWLDIPVIMQDEAGTSIEAERLLRERGKPYEKSDIDAEAAALILQDYLNLAAGQVS